MWTLDDKTDSVTLEAAQNWIRATLRSRSEKRINSFPVPSISMIGEWIEDNSRQTKHKLICAYWFRYFAVGNRPSITQTLEIFDYWVGIFRDVRGENRNGKCKTNP